MKSETIKILEKNIYLQSWSLLILLKDTLKPLKGKGN